MKVLANAQVGFPHLRVGPFLTQRGQAFLRVPLSSNTGHFISQPGVCKPVRYGEKAGGSQQGSSHIPG